MKPLGVVAGGDQERAGRVGADAEGPISCGEAAAVSSASWPSRLVISASSVWQRRARCLSASLLAASGLPRTPGRSWAVLLTSRVVESALSWSRSSGGAVTSSERRALIAWVRALIAVPRATRNTRIISTRSSPAFGEPAASADRTARAAASASVGSDLPLRRRVWRLGRITSTTSLSRARKCRAKAAP